MSSWTFLESKIHSEQILAVLTCLTLSMSQVVNPDCGFSRFPGLYSDKVQVEVQDRNTVHLMAVSKYMSWIQLILELCWADENGGRDTGIKETKICEIKKNIASIAWLLNCIPEMVYKKQTCIPACTAPQPRAGEVKSGQRILWNVFYIITKLETQEIEFLASLMEKRETYLKEGWRNSLQAFCGFHSSPCRRKRTQVVMSLNFSKKKRELNVNAKQQYLIPE